MQFFLFRLYIRALLLTTVKTCLCQEVRYEDATSHRPPLFSFTARPLTSRPLLPLLDLQCPTPTGVSFTPLSLVPSLLTPNPRVPQRLGLVGCSMILCPCPGAEKGVWGQETPPAAAPGSPPSAPPKPGLRRFLGGWLGLAAAAAVLLCHARRRQRRPELEGEEGRNLISPVAKGWRQTPSSPRAAREQGGLRYPGGPSPRGR